VAAFADRSTTGYWRIRHPSPLLAEPESSFRTPRDEDPAELPLPYPPHLEKNGKVTKRDKGVQPARELNPGGN